MPYITNSTFCYSFFVTGSRFKVDGLVKSRKIPFWSHRRKSESSHFNSFWTPALAGVTELGLFTRASKLESDKN